jgi:hypothetical protein
MEKFTKALFLFMGIGILLGEIVVRIFCLNVDVPKAYLAKDNLIKFYPNQTGNYLHSSHKWIINKYGNFGYETKSLDSLVTVIGDSYIENMMNPPECHQAKYLAELLPRYNYYSSARAGASFVEMMERAKSLESMNPLYQLLYVHQGDFTESISEIKKNPLTIQYSLKSNEISYAKLQSSKFKEVLYNCKFFYYIYRNFIVKTNHVSSNNRDQNNKEKIDYDLIEKLVLLVKHKYKTHNVILVFSPDTDLKVVEIAKRNGFRYFLLKTDNYKSWQLLNDSHWSCFGHEQAALNVSSELIKMN